MADKKNLNEKKQAVKDILRALHRGLEPEKAAARVLAEASYLTAGEIAAIEEELIKEGTDPAEIQKFCSVHALIFEKALEGKAAAGGGAEVIDLFRQENALIKKLAVELQEAAADPARAGRLLGSSGLVIRHYVKKEQALFPLLEKRGFTGPSKVMWGKHDEVRRLFKDARAALEAGAPAAAVRVLIERLAAEIEGMVEKEELILFPTAEDKLTPEDLAGVRAAFIDLEKEIVAGERSAAAAIDAAGSSGPADPAAAAGEIALPSGRLAVEELTRIFNLLPVDVSFVDKNDRVKYFSETQERIFPRARSVIGREVRNCHPPKSLAAVEKIVNAFKAGRKDKVDFWINLGGKMIFIRYVAVRGEQGDYLGTLEVSQDITGLRALTGEKRLLDEKDV